MRYNESSNNQNGRCWSTSLQVGHLENLREIDSSKLLSLILEAFNGNTDPMEHIVAFRI